MSLFRLKVEVRSYLQFEVIGTSPDDVMERFEAAVRAKAKKGRWPEEEIQGEIDRIKPDWIDELAPGVMLDYEPFYV